MNRAERHKNIVENARNFAYREWEYSKVKLPSIRDYKGRNAYKSFHEEMKEATERVNANKALYKECSALYGRAFVEQVEKERKEIGRKYLGYK